MKKITALIIVLLLITVIASPAYAANKKDDERESKDWLGMLKSAVNNIYWKIVYYVGPASLVFMVIYLIRGAMVNPEKTAEYRKIGLTALAGYFTLVLLPWVIGWLRDWMASQGVSPWRPGK